MSGSLWSGILPCLALLRVVRVRESARVLQWWALLFSVCSTIVALLFYVEGGWAAVFRIGTGFVCFPLLFVFIYLALRNDTHLWRGEWEELLRHGPRKVETDTLASFGAKQERLIPDHMENDIHELWEDAIREILMRDF